MKTQQLKYNSIFLHTQLNWSLQDQFIEGYSKPFSATNELILFLVSPNLSFFDYMRNSACLTWTFITQNYQMWHWIQCWSQQWHYVVYISHQLPMYCFSMKRVKSSLEYTNVSTLTQMYIQPEFKKDDRYFVILLKEIGTVPANHVVFFILTIKGWLSPYIKMKKREM